ncbi:telomere binding protein [Maudiozyma exigua]|uniref:Telomere binding protein n=1 Tax=Maudiozyma exigua TaxID=34358 RepID=A0A9P6W9J7_MAUEX|nr:telomere binding protein [Kazachstania exigua]
MTSTIEESDSDDEDDELEQEILDIVFLKDLLEMYVKFGRGTSGDQIPLLKRTTQLVRQKESLPLEVNYYAPPLLTHISSINNNREEEGFEQSRINALVAILVVIPEHVESLYKILFNSELSIQQRISLLSSLALSARELRGLDDKQIHKPHYDFPSQRLPWDDGHSAVKQIEEIPVLDKITGFGISEGTTVWKSQKLAIQDKMNSGQHKNRFRSVASSYFYPLVHGWKNGINLGSFDQLFKSHYVSTLRIIHNCAYPVHDFETMTYELDQIITEAQAQGIPILE